MKRNFMEIVRERKEELQVLGAFLTVLVLLGILARLGPSDTEWFKLGGTAGYVNLDNITTLSSSVSLWIIYKEGGQLKEDCVLLNVPLDSSTIMRDVEKAVAEHKNNMDSYRCRAYISLDGQKVALPDMDALNIKFTSPEDITTMVRHWRSIYYNLIKMLL